MTVLYDLLRGLMVFLDTIAYGLISPLYELFMDIAATKIFADDTINAFADRIYSLLAIFMLFRLSFSILTYIVNPDSAADKKTGGGKLIVNVLITIVLLISTPWLFRNALTLQNDLLKDNVVGKLILGTKNTSVTTQLTPGDTMAWQTFSAFFKPNETLCPDGTCCYNTLDKNGEKDVKISGLSVCDAYERVNTAQSVKAVSKYDMVNVKNNAGEYMFDYTPIISTIAGGFIAYVLLLFCIQIAVRTVKLGVLQLIAPIPIMSFLDPKQGKDGMFKKWLSITGKTFADVFIRLAAIYFAVFIISEITEGGGMTNMLTGNATGGFAKVLIIIGALTFAKDLPKFIEEITGIKLDGGFSLNPFKNNAFLGAAVGGAIGAGMGAVGGFAGNLLAGNRMRDAVRGGLKGFASGGMGGIKDKGIKKDTFTRGAKAGVTTGTNYANWAASGSRMRGRMMDRMRSTVGAKTAAEKYDAQIKAYDDIAGLYGKAEDFALSEIAKPKNAAMAVVASGAYAGKNYNIEKEKLESLRNSGADAADIEAQRQLVENVKEQVVKQYMDSDPLHTIETYKTQANNLISEYALPMDKISDAESFNKRKGESKAKSNEIKRSDGYRSAKANEAANKQAKASK